MARMNSDLTEVADLGALPKGEYHSQIRNITEGKGKQPPHNPYLTFDYLVLSGEFKDRQIRFDNVITGGTGKNGPLTPFQLARLINSFHLPWACASCNPDLDSLDDASFQSRCRVKPFLIGTGTTEEGGNGLKKGEYFCPDCRQKMKISYETNMWLGAEGKVITGVPEKRPDSDRENTNITGYASL